MGRALGCGDFRSRNSVPYYRILDSPWENFKLFGLIYDIYPKKFELFWAWLLKKRGVHGIVIISEAWVSSARGPPEILKLRPVQY